ncbi:MAG: amidohydrolase [Thermoplasmata archaeon]
MTDSDLFLGGRVFTGRRYSEALLVEGGEVLLAGTESEARRTAATGAARHDLHGGLLVPGLIDAHIHVADLTRAREGLDLGGVASVPNLVETVRRWADAHPSGPVSGRGWDPERFPGGTWPAREDVDRAVPDRPAVLTHVSGHAVVVNSTALRAAGLDRSVPDPPGGRVGRAPDGTPDGRLFESAIGLVERGLGPRPTPEPAALARTLSVAASLGLTALGAMSADPEEALALRDLAGSESLTVRTRVYLRGDRWEGFFRAPSAPAGPPGRFAVVGVKAYTDGAFGPRTAWLAEPYLDAPGSSGLPVAVETELDALLAAARERDLAPALHAIGDRAVEYAVTKLGGLPPYRGAPDRIEHAALTPPPVIESLVRVRPALVVQPGFVWSDHWLGARLGGARARWAYAFRSLVDHGLLVAGSSDAPYDPIDPWRGLRAAVQRTDPVGRSANPTPTEALAPEVALQLYTVNAGAALGEAALGALEPGSPADLLLLEAPSLELAFPAGSLGIRETWMAGVRWEPGARARDPQSV